MLSSTHRVIHFCFSLCFRYVLPLLVSVSTISFHPLTWWDICPLATVGIEPSCCSSLDRRLVPYLEDPGFDPSSLPSWLKFYGNYQQNIYTPDGYPEFIYHPVIRNQVLYPLSGSIDILYLDGLLSLFGYSLQRYRLYKLWGSFGV